MLCQSRILHVVRTALADLLGEPFCSAMPEGAINGCDALLDRVFRTGTTETLDDQEHISLDPDVYWSYTAWVVLDEAEQRVGVMIQITDTSASLLARERAAALNESLMISNLKQLEDMEILNVRLERAMEETHHRVKNNLQIISSLVEMQIDDGDVANPLASLERIASYIHSLALLHDLLTQKVKSHSDDDTLSTAVSLNQLLPLLQSSVGTRRIATDIADIALPAFTSVSLSLLINELITNAAKHSMGDILLRLTQEGKYAILTVNNAGEGFPPNFDPVRDAHTGMGLILSFARHDLRGTIAFSNPPEGGACVTVRFPIPAGKTGE